MAELLRAADQLSEAADAQGPDRGLPPAAGQSPTTCVFAQTTTTRVGGSDAPHHAVPVRRQARLRPVRVHRVGRPRGRGAPPAAGRHPGRRHLLVLAAGRPRRQRRPDARLHPPLAVAGLGPRGRASRGRNRRTCYNFRVLPEPSQPSRATRLRARALRKVRAVRKFAFGLTQHVAPAARPHHPDPPLQHRLRLLQRVRQGLAAGADRRDARAHRPPRRAEARRSSPSAAASRCSIPTSTS